MIFLFYMKTLNESYKSSILRNIFTDNSIAKWYWNGLAVSNITYFAERGCSEVTDDDIVCIFNLSDNTQTVLNLEEYKKLSALIKVREITSADIVKIINNGTLSKFAEYIGKHLRQSMIVKDKIIIILNTEGSLKIWEACRKHADRKKAKFDERGRNNFSDQERGREFADRKAMNNAIPKILGEKYKPWKEPMFIYSKDVPGKKFRVSVTGIMDGYSTLTIGPVDDRVFHKLIKINFGENQEKSYRYITVKTDQPEIFGIDKSESYVTFEASDGKLSYTGTALQNDPVCKVFTTETAKDLAIAFAKYLGVESVDYKKICAF